MSHALRAVCALILCAPALLASSAGASTLSASISADPVEDTPVTFTLSGTADVATALSAFVSPEARACEPTAALQDALGGGQRLSPVGGAPVVAGAFSREFTLTPATDGAFRLCGYLTAVSPAAVTTATTAFVVRQPSTLATVIESPPYEPGDTIKARVTASSGATNRELRFGWTSFGVACSSLIETTSVPLTAGSAVERQISLPATDPTGYRLCAAVIEQPGALREVVSEVVAAALPRDVLLERWRPVPITDDSVQYDRLRLEWRTRGILDEDEVLRVWDVDPSDADDPVVHEDLESEGFELMNSADDVRDVRVRNFLGYRQFWWSAGTTLSTGDVAWSAVRTVRVAPRPMDRDRVRVSPKLTLRRSSRRPGTVRVRITSSPRARVSFKVLYRGRPYASRRYVEGVGGLRGFDFKLSCAKTGRFSYEVHMRDPYGAKSTKRGSWESSASRCQSLRAEEQRKIDAARRRAQAKERERRARQKPAPSSGGSGGSGCHPNYSGCLKADASDYDCSGGSGNGPYYVDGPVTVTGADPFDLDRDGNGVGCES